MSNNTKEDLIGRVIGRLREMELASDLLDDAAAARMGLNRTDHRAMDVLERESPITPSRLAELCGLSRGAVTTVIDRLERAGYARRTPDPEDRRSVLVEMTPEARERAMGIYGPIGERAFAAFQRFTVAELETVERFLQTASEVRWRAVGMVSGDATKAP